MLPDKNKLNNETIEQVNGGGGYTRLRDPSQGINPTQEVEITPARVMPSADTMEALYTPSNSGKQYSSIEQRTDSETQIMPKIAPVGDDLKTTIPSISNKDGLVKIH